MSSEELSSTELANQLWLANIAAANKYRPDADLLQTPVDLMSRTAQAQQRLEELQSTLSDKMGRDISLQEAQNFIEFKLGPTRGRDYLLEPAEKTAARLLQRDYRPDVANESVVRTVHLTSTDSGDVHISSTQVDVNKVSINAKANAGASARIGDFEAKTEYDALKQSTKQSVSYKTEGDPWAKTSTSSNASKSDAFTMGAEANLGANGKYSMAKAERRDTFITEDGEKFAETVVTVKLGDVSVGAKIQGKVATNEAVNVGVSGGAQASAIKAEVGIKAGTVNERETRTLGLSQGEFVLQPVPSFPRRRESRMH